MNAKNIEIHALTQELAEINKLKASTTSDAVVAMLNNQANAITLKLRELGHSEGVVAELERAAAAMMPSANVLGFTDDFPVVVGIKAVNGAANALFTDQMYLNDRIETLSTSMARRVGDERRQQSVFSGANNTNPNERPEEELMRLQERLEKGLELICSLHKEHERLVERAVSEGIELDLGQNGGRGFDAFPSPEDAFSRREAKKRENQARWNAEKTALKAVVPSAYSLITPKA